MFYIVRKNRKDIDPIKPIVFKMFFSCSSGLIKFRLILNANCNLSDRLHKPAKKFRGMVACKILCSLSLFLALFLRGYNQHLKTRCTRAEQ